MLYFKNLVFGQKMESSSFFNFMEKATFRSSSLYFPELNLGWSLIWYKGLNYQFKLKEISSFYHLPKLPVYIRPLFSPDLTQQIFLYQICNGKAQDSTQDVRLKASHCLAQHWNVLKLFILFLAFCLHPQDGRKGVVLLLVSGVGSCPLKKHTIGHVTGGNGVLQPAVLTKDSPAKEMSQTVSVWRVLGRCSPARGSINKMQTAEGKEYQQWTKAGSEWAGISKGYRLLFGKPLWFQ